VKLRDLNGDGWLDLIWADSAPPYDFRTRLNLGNGSFGAVDDVASTPAATATSTRSTSTATATSTRSSPSTSAARTSPDNRVFLCKNKGDGTFETPTILVTYLKTEIVGHGDLDRDGNEDLVLTSDGVEVYLGNGDGTFQPRMRFATDWGAKDMVVADLSGDGILDLATYNFGDTTSAQRRRVDERPPRQRRRDVPPRVNSTRLRTRRTSAIRRARAVDVDGDGDLDLVGGTTARTTSRSTERGPRHVRATGALRHGMHTSTSRGGLRRRRADRRPRRSSACRRAASEPRSRSSPATRRARSSPSASATARRAPARAATPERRAAAARAP
jgi:hypothetical protein